MTIRNRTAAITGTNQFTPWMTLRQGGIITVTGTFSATLVLQRRGADGNAVPVTNNSGSAVTFTAVGTYTIDPNKFGGDYRVGIATGGTYTSGTANVLLEGR